MTKSIIGAVPYRWRRSMASGERGRGDEAAGPLRPLPLLGAHTGRVALAILLGGATVAGNVALLAIAGYLLAEAARRTPLTALAIPIYLVRVLAVGRAFSRYADRLIAHDLTLRLLAQVRLWCFRRLAPLAPGRLLTFRAGDLLSRAAQDVEELEHLYLRAVAPPAVALLTGALAVWWLGRFSPLLALVTTGALLAAGLGLPALAGLLGRGPGRAQLAARAALNAHLVDGLHGIAELATYGDAARAHQAQLAALDRAAGQAQARAAWIAALRQGLHEALRWLATLAALLLVLPLLATGRVDGVLLAALVLVVAGAFDATQPLSEAFQFLGRTAAAAARLGELAATAPAVTEPDLPETGGGSRRLKSRLPPAKSPCGDSVLARAERSVGLCSSVGATSAAGYPPTLAFEGVSFTYPGQDAPTLEGISLALRLGRRVAIVGPSGVGKSTILRLALRCWDPSAGAILLGGRDLRHWPLAEVRGACGSALQDATVFADTLRHNLLLARPTATDAELLGALERAQLGELLATLPGGLDAWLGEQGVRLSGGERQRLLLARALLKEAPILLLDEPTANLDPLTEGAALAAIHEGLGERALLLVTHRLVQMERFDEILVLERGHIVARGRHTELAATGGLYRRLLDEQAQALLSI